MPYLFRCTYCNQETDINLYDADMERNCDNCGEDMCQACINPNGLCLSCQDDRDDEWDDENA